MGFDVVQRKAQGMAKCGPASSKAVECVGRWWEAEANDETPELPCQEPGGNQPGIVDQEWSGRGSSRVTVAHMEERLCRAKYRTLDTG